MSLLIKKFLENLQDSYSGNESTFKVCKKDKQSECLCNTMRYWCSIVRNKMQRFISNVFYTTGNHLNEMKFVKFNHEQRNRIENLQIEIGCKRKTLSIWINRFFLSDENLRVAVFVRYIYTFRWTFMFIRGTHLTVCSSLRIKWINWP